MLFNQVLKNKKNIYTFTIYVFAITLGILSGYSEIHFLKVLGTTVSDVFIKLFKCLSLPLIGLSIIVTLSSYSPGSWMKNLWKRALTYTLGTTLISASLTFVLYLLINPSTTYVVGQEISLPSAQNFSYLNYLIQLIPSHILEPFLQQQVIGVMIVSITMGMAIRTIPDQASRQTIAQFFKGLHGIFLVITKWIIAVIPLVLYGFVTQTVLQLRQGMDLSGVTEYLAIIVLSNIIQGGVVLPLWLWLNKISPRSTFQGMAPALSLAFFSKSSAGTLPVTMNAAEKRLGLDPEVSRFVLPLCTTINMNGCATFIFATVVFLMQNHGIQLSLGTMALWILISTVAAIGNAGVPMGCFFLSASLLSSMGVPITLLGVILPFYGVIDMIETSLNVWSDACVATVIDKNLREETKLGEIANYEPEMVT